MTEPTFAIVHWQGERKEGRARKIVSLLERDGLRRAGGGAQWLCLTRRPAQRLGESLQVVGRLYTRNERPALSPDGGDQDEFRRITRTHWGSYVAFSESEGHLRVLADPVGSWPLWELRAPGLIIVADRIGRELANAAGLPGNIVPSALAATLLDTACASHLSFVQGIAPLEPGCIHWLATGQRAVAWDPTEIAQRVIERPGEALRSAVDEAVSEQADTPLVVQLSGGLDSGIVLSSLSGSGKPASCINYATAASAGDERSYARLVARLCSVECFEVTADRLPDFRRIADGDQGAAPPAFGLDDAFELAVDAFASATGARHVMTGQGGDAVFLQPPTPLVAVDRARALGLGPATWPALLDDARRSRSSLWQHVAAALRDKVGTTSVPTEAFAPHLLTERALSWVSDRDLRHPWLRAAKGVPPGKRLQVTMLANSQIFHGARATGRTPLLHPLLSQPVIEAALAIPTFELALGDNDRGLARRVFGDRLPPELVRRRSKGEASDHYSRAALANLDFLRDFLLDGRLVALGILDPVALSALLTKEGLFHSRDYSGLPMQVSCEAWARKWSD